MNKYPEKLILIIIFASKITVEIEDKFFQEKVFSKLKTLLRSYLDFCAETNVAQYKQNYFKFNSEIDSFLDAIDYIIHSKNYNLIPLLKLKRRILDFKLTMVKDLKKSIDPSVYEERERGVVKAERSEITKPQILNPNLKNEPASSKGKILDFIRKSKKTRTKDLIEEFSAFSERTVKRTLKELTSDGILKREEIDRAVYYSIII